MAWTQKMPNGDFRAFWRDSSGRVRSATFDKKTRQKFTGPSGETAAKKYGIGQEAIARDNSPQADARGLTWGQWRDRWLELRRVQPSTAEVDARRIKKYLDPKWDRVLIRRVDDRQVQAWIHDLTDSYELSPSTVARIFHLFSASMKAAQKDRKITSNPCQLIDLPATVRGKEHYLTKREVDLVIEHITDPTMADVVLFLAYTGLRWSEMAGLHWHRVDQVNGTVAVVETWDEVAGEIKPYPKSKKPRHVPLTGRVQAMLANRPVDTGSCGLKHRGGSACGSSLVFARSNGRPLDYHNLRTRQWAAAVEMAKLPRTRLHDLRHSFASWQAQAGVPLHVIQQMLGHQTITTTERYSHFGAEQHETVLKALE